MRKMLIKYLLNYPKTDSITGVGLLWEPGQTRNVSPEVAEKLAVYTDTWAKTPDEEAVSTESVGLKPEEKPVEEPLPVIDFHGMNKHALLEFAESNYNERLDKPQSQDNSKQNVIGLLSKYYAGNFYWQTTT